MEPNYLDKLKKEIEKGLDVKGYGTFILIILMLVFIVNFGLDNPIGKALDTKKSCEEINGVCSDKPCGKGFTQTENLCYNKKYCCTKKE
jgi:hypothetical protein